MHSYISGGPQAATLLPPIPTRTIVGAGLANCHLDKRQRACLAADVIDGLVTFIPSQKQLADLLGVSVPYINVARRLSAGKRTAILRGWDPVSFTGLMNPPPRQLSLVGPVIPDMRMTDTTKITNSYLEAVIRAVGVDRTLEVAIGVERS
jgi:hypothetical protein